MLHVNLEASSTFLRKTKIMNTLFKNETKKTSISSNAVCYFTASHAVHRMRVETPRRKQGEILRVLNSNFVGRRESETLLNSHRRKRRSFNLPLRVEWGKLKHSQRGGEFQVRAKAGIIHDAQQKKRAQYISKP